ncbi:hypothetical protein L218DRAFT_944298 [Marasmius fiardii PR-910]|nr:hypothetical protein L218DRAFT_944298 [Marasmius fiardii PR-910]
MPTANHNLPRSMKGPQKEVQGSMRADQMRTERTQGAIKGTNYQLKYLKTTQKTTQGSGIKQIDIRDWTSQKVYRQRNSNRSAKLLTFLLYCPCITSGRTIQPEILCMRNSNSDSPTVCTGIGFKISFNNMGLQRQFSGRDGQTGLPEADWEGVEEGVRDADRYMAYNFSIFWAARIWSFSASKIV